MSASTPSHPAWSSVIQSDCCIVGAGPAGAVLALILGRCGINVTLLEAHQDFNRAFRGDSLHPSVLELMDALGLAEQLLRLPHTKIERVTLHTPARAEPLLVSDLRRLHTPYPYIMMLPQAQFLECIVAEAQRTGLVRVVRGARVEALIEEAGSIGGVQYRDDDGWHAVQARLTVGSDGRFSRVRRLSGLASVATAAPLDVLWFELPRSSNDSDHAGAMLWHGAGGLIALFDRGTMWQVGYTIPKGSYQHLRAAGLPALQNAVAKLVPVFADRVASLQSWSQVALLSVEASCLQRWYRSGLLLIGDAAHVMSPLGGVGINYAIQDAVVAANMLAQPLRFGGAVLPALHAIQHQRHGPTWRMQAMQALIQRRLIPANGSTSEDYRLPLSTQFLLQWSPARDLVTRLVAVGIPRVRLTCAV